MKRAIRLGTRGSKLATTQTHWVADRLVERHPGLEVTIELVRTTGDQVQDRPLGDLGVVGAFTRELDQALVEGRVDAAVHSLKDVPTEGAEGICVAAVPEREDPRDAFIGKDGVKFADLPKGAVVGTGSLRRQAMLALQRPDLETEELRGNIDTRLRLLRESDRLQGIVLALAGVRRLGLEGVVTEVLGPPDWLPAPGQGALAITTRNGDGRARELVAALEDRASRAAVTAERAVLERLGGGCHVPIGTFALVQDEHLAVEGLVADPTGTRVIRGFEEGVAGHAEAIGIRLGERLLSMGAVEILACGGKGGS